MKIQISHLAAAAALVVSAAGLLAAQSFEQTLNDALKKDGALGVEMSSLKQCVDDHSVQTQDINAQSEEEQQYKSEDFEAMYGSHGGGGHHGGGGYHPGSGPRPGTHPGTHPHPSPAGHRDWSRWSGHPGWGYGQDWHWGWDPFGRPIWWVWATVPAWYPGMNLACYDYYAGTLGNCDSACSEGNFACGSYCRGDAAFLGQCYQNTNACKVRCQMDFDERKHNVCNVRP